MMVGGIARPVVLRTASAPPSKEAEKKPEQHAPVVVVIPGEKPKDPSPETIRRIRGGASGAVVGASIGFYTSVMLLSGSAGMVVGLSAGGFVLGALIGTALSS